MMSRGAGSADGGDLRRFPFRAAAELEVFTKTVSNFKQHKKLLRDDVTDLACVFDAMQVQGFLELLDENCVTVLRSHLTRRLLVQVHSSKMGDVYFIPPGDSFCQCRAYQRANKYYCKHVLAAHFYLAVSSSDEYKDVAEKEMNTLLKNLSSGNNSSAHRR